MFWVLPKCAVLTYPYKGFWGTILYFGGRKKSQGATVETLGVLGSWQAPCGLRTIQSSLLLPRGVLQSSDYSISKNLPSHKSHVAAHSLEQKMGAGAERGVAKERKGWQKYIGKIACIVLTMHYSLLASAPPPQEGCNCNTLKLYEAICLLTYLLMNLANTISQMRLFLFTVK